MLGRNVRVAVLLGSVLAGAAPGCVTDHSALAKRDTGGTGGVAEAGADAGASGSGGAGASAMEAGTDADAAVEPPGENVLTLLHAVVDAKTVAFCFARVTATETEILGAPVPSAGLAYGGSLSLSTIAGIDLGADDVQPFVIAADSAALSGSDCAALIAAAEVELDAGVAEPDGAPPDPAIRARGLPVIPKGTLSGGFSYLLAAAGCLGAPSHTGPLDESVCGSGYSPSTPTLAPVVVQISRVTQPGKLGLQVVHASLASDLVDVVSEPPDESSLSALVIAYGVVPGAIEPRPPNLAYPLAIYGSPLGESSLRISFTTGPSTALDVPWSEVLGAGGIPALADGKSYALVFIGPSLHIGPDQWWNAPTLSIVPSDPAQ